MTETDVDVCLLQPEGNVGVTTKFSLDLFIENAFSSSYANTCLRDLSCITACAIHMLCGLQVIKPKFMRHGFCLPDITVLIHPVV